MPPSVDWPVEIGDVEGAQAYADIRGFRFDLEVTANIVDLLVAALERNMAADFTLAMALSNAAIVQYARCFKTGVRDALPKQLVDRLGNSTDELPEFPATCVAYLRDRLEAHQYFLDVRDKFIAHSVSGYEDNAPAARLSSDPRWHGIARDVSVLSRRRLGLGVEAAKELQALARGFDAMLSIAEQRAGAALLERVRAVPYSELVGRGQAQFDGQDVDPSAPRSRRPTRARATRVPEPGNE